MKINKIIAGIMAVCVIGFGVPCVSMVADNTAITASAEGEAEYTEGTYEHLKYRNYGDYIEISYCDKFTTDVVIPSEIEGVPVTSIGDCAFQNCDSLKSINIPNSVTSIGYSAFYWCSSLTSIKIPNSVKSIGSKAFEECSSLTSIELPEGITSIGRLAFSSTPWLEEKQKENPLVIVNNILIDGKTCTGDVVIIPDGVTIIADGAFEGCNSLTSIEISDSVTSIGLGAFYSCESLTSVNIPDSVTRIGNNAFSECESLTSINIPDGVTSIEDFTFYDCSSLTSINIPESVTNIGRYAFSSTPWLAEKQKENPLVIINNILIDGTTCQDDVVIPDGVTSISGGAFYNCNLTSIEIPDSVTSIGYRAFCICSSLESITILNPECNIFDDSATISDDSSEPPNFAFASYYFSGTIYGYDNSTAKAYAEKYAKKFESLRKAPENDSSTGDVNGNGLINISDVVLFQEYLLGRYTFTEEQFKNADMTDDGFVDSFDLVLLKRKAVYGE